LYAVFYCPLEGNGGMWHAMQKALACICARIASSAMLSSYASLNCGFVIFYSLQLCEVF
jgi:hypothetical protein